MKKEKVKIYWIDAVLYKNGNIPSGGLTKMITIGELFIKNSKFIVIKNPKTIKEKKISLSKIFREFSFKKPRFFMIPIGMVKKIENI